MMKNYPPFQITPSILELSQKISRLLGLIAGQKLFATPLKLRRSNRIKTIQASLSIEGNTLSLEQVTDLLDGKRILGPQKDILEVKNALSVYEELKKLNPLQESDLLRAHHVLMQGLTEEVGKWRSGRVAILKAQAVTHIAPPPHKVPDLMHTLFAFLKKEDHLSWLMKACIFHYELEFIHPFADGNGRMGRLWQQVLLMKEDPIFEFIPVEVMIKARQEEYYKALGESDSLGESTPFIEFSLQSIVQALSDYTQTTKPLSLDSLDRLNLIQETLKNAWFSRKTYLQFHKDISSATASRDLGEGYQKGLLEKKGLKNQTTYRFIKKD